MRSRAMLFAPVLAVLYLALPLAAHATGIPFFGPIIPPDARLCAAGLGQLAQVVNNTIAFIITLLVLLVAPFVIVWAGFLLVVSVDNPGNRAKARGLLINLAIGLVFALGAWLIVDTLLTTLTTKGGVVAWTSQIFNTSGGCLPISGQSLSEGTPSIGGFGGGGGVASDNTFLLTGDQACGSAGVCTGEGCTPNEIGPAVSCNDGSIKCLYPRADPNNGCQLPAGVTVDSLGTTGGAVSGNFGVSGAQCASDNPACSVSALEAAGLTSAQANVMSCIAVTESSGNPNNVNSKSGACGTFQFVPGTLNSVSQHVSSCSSGCSNAACGTQGVAYLINNRISLGQDPFGDWTCATCNSKAAACVSQYGGG